MSRINISINYEIPETLQENHAKCLEQEDVNSSGILDVIADVAKQMRHEYVDVPPTTDTHRPFLEIELYEKAVSRILDQARLLDGVKGESSMDHKLLIENIRPYATSIWTRKFAVDAVCCIYIKLQKLVICANAIDRRVMIVNDDRLPIYSYEDASYLKAILLLDAACDVLHVMVQKLLLEIKAMLSAQEIYLNYARLVADMMTAQYDGKTRVSHKGNRTTLHFYLSDSEKAVITFFQERMPWDLPSPPTDPESLRKVCQEDGAPYFIEALSKKDRKV